MCERLFSIFSFVYNEIMFNTAQHGPIIANAGLSPEAPRPMPAAIAPVVNATPPPTITEGSVHSVYHNKPLHQRFRFFIPAMLVLLTMALVAFVVQQGIKTRTSPTAISTPLPSLTPATPVPTPKVDPKASWKSYLNRDQRIQFKYPQSLSLKEEFSTLTRNRIVLTGEKPAAEASFMVIVGLKTQLGSILSTYTEDKESISNPVETEFQVAGLPGVKVSGVLPGQGEGVPYIYGYVELDTFIYLFVQQGVLTTDENLFTEILESVRFLPEGITDEWKTFQNTLTNYSFRYPEDWEVSTGGGVATASAGRVIVKKTSGETEYQNLIIDTSIQAAGQKIELTASEVVSSLQNLSGWKTKPALDFRNIGGASAQIVSGELGNSWQMYVVLWYKNVLVQMSWKDGLTRAEQTTVDNILSTFTFQR